MSIIQVSDFDTFGDWKTKTNAVATQVGDLALLQTDANATIIGAINEIKNGNIRNINVSGTNYSIYLNGVRKVHITDIGDIDLSNNVNVTGNFTAGGFGSIGGRLDIGGVLDVDGATQINNTFKVTSATTLDTTLSVGGNTTIAGTLAVIGTVTATVTKCARSITPGAGLSYILGGGDLTADRTIAVDASTTATANKVVARDDHGDIAAASASLNTSLKLVGTLSQIVQSDLGDEAADAGIDEGRIEYSTARWILKAGSNSARIVDFKRGGNMVSYIATDGVYNGTATAARYADLAEKYTMDQEYPAGTVIVVSHSSESECTASFQPCQLALGVISTNPAYMMNSEAEGQYVALKGRVPVRVVGAIMKGQTLVATANGTAIYGQLNPIGSALETNLDMGEKLVEVAII